MPYYIGDLKRDPNLENYPYGWKTERGGIMIPSPLFDVRAGHAGVPDPVTINYKTCKTLIQHDN